MGWQKPPFEPLDFPPWMRWRRRKGALLNQVKDRGPNGRRLCRWCREEVPKGRQSWCGETCANKYLRVFTWMAVREYVIGRDRVCQRCGCEHPGWRKLDARHGWHYCYLVAWHWEVDHIQRITDGGTDDPENLRLLCHDCHVLVGYEQRAAAKAKNVLAS